MLGCLSACLLLALSHAMMMQPVPRPHYGNHLLRSLAPIYVTHAPVNRTLEHVVPASVLRRRAPLAARRDMHNLFATAPYLNQIRAARRFAEVDASRPRDFTHVGGGNYVDRGQAVFCPSVAYRGTVARAVLYMCNRWGCEPGDVVCGGSETLWRWHEEDAPGADERLHNYLVFKMQHNSNPFISNATDAEELLREMYPVDVLRLRQRPGL